MKVKNMTSSKGNAIANQFIIYDNEDKYFKSYDSIIKETQAKIKADHEVVRGTLYIYDTHTKEKLASLDIDELYLNPIDLKEEFQDLIDSLKEQNIYLNDEKTALEDVLDYAKEFEVQDKFENNSKNY